MQVTPRTTIKELGGRVVGRLGIGGWFVYMWSTDGKVADFLFW